MKKHLLCLTVDTDPDGLSGKVTNRQSLEWEGLKQLQCLPDELGACSRRSRIPVTWFVRADGQLENVLGSASYLLETFQSFWMKTKAGGDELGWHPHLYRQRKADQAVLITDSDEAQDELERLWSKLKTAFQPSAFRNGEGWHTPKTYATVEKLGFACDSSAIPGRRGDNGHPMNWEGAPNVPYFPAPDGLCKRGEERPMLELPMNTWLLRAPYDDRPRIRYMNPAVHSCLFAYALKNWENACTVLSEDLCVWVMIFHPDEVLASRTSDALYSRSIKDLCLNVNSVVETLDSIGHDYEWVTISEAANRWRRYQKRLVA